MLNSEADAAINSGDFEHCGNTVTNAYQQLALAGKRMRTGELALAIDLHSDGLGAILEPAAHTHLKHHQAQHRACLLAAWEPGLKAFPCLGSAAA